MQEFAVFGLDLAKNVFKVHGVAADGGVVLQLQLRPSKVLRFFAELNRCLVGIEACASAHQWARELSLLGH